MQRNAIAMGAAYAVLAGLAGCGGSDLTVGATPTVTVASTRTATPTPAPTATTSIAAVGGLIVVNQDVRGAAGDGLMPLPPESLPPGGTGFDRGLGNANWMVDDGVISGSTTIDGHFSITGLSPGPHVIHVSKSVDGNLLDLDLPIIVGDDGSAEVLAQVSWGLVLTTSTYTQGGAAMRAVYAPNGSHLITRNGQAVELGDYFRTLVDADGDGSFDPQTGSCDQLYRCDAQGGCGDADHICMCIPSCPGCEDCAEKACVSRASLMRPDCGPDGLCKTPPYRCASGDACAQTGDRCACVASCPECDDCNGSACVAPCQPSEPVDILSVTIYGPSPLLVGQESSASATLALSDGSGIDVTWLVTWTSSAAAVATVDSFGRIAALAVGPTNITATLDDVTSTPLALAVVERPTLRRIYLQNASCLYPLAMRDDASEPKPVPPTDTGFLPPPLCQQVVRIGATLQFSAIGEFDTGYYEDISDEVTWQLDPAAVGDVVNGVFTARQAGVSQLTAALAGVESDPIEIKVVTEATVVALSVYPVDWGYKYIDGGPARPGMDAPCYECGYSLTLLRGDHVRFAATAHYDTGEWRDVSSQVTWRSGDAAVASIDASGTLTAEGAGDTAIDATFGEVTSAVLTVRVVDQATLQSLYAYQDGQDRVIGKGEQVAFHAVGYYDVGFDRDVTDQVTWHSSDEGVGGFDTAGIFTGRAAGTVDVWAELDGQQSTPISIEVFATSELTYCDAANINRGVWSDDFNRVTLESDCDAYTPPGVVELRFSVTETQRPGGVFDPCLDLYAYRGDTLVRTIREEGCGDPFVPVGAPGREDAILKYQLKAFWDLKDASGQTVAPGTYTIRGRFYLYYDPVVQIDVRVNEAASPN
jgi:hypothetical protein